MSSVGAAHRPAISVSSARAEASRRNGARSCGCKSSKGKGRSSQNALEHRLPLPACPLSASSSPPRATSPGPLGPVCGDGFPPDMRRMLKG